MQRPADGDADDRAPRLHRINVPQPADRGALKVGFTYEAGSAPIAVVEITAETTLGGVTDTAPSGLAGAVQHSGAGVVTLNLAALPAGRCELALVLVDRKQRRSAPASFGLDVPGGPEGARRPVLRAVGAEQERLTRPGGNDLVNAWFVVGCERGGSELAGVYVRVRAPGGGQRGFVAPLPPQAGDAGVARVRLLAFGAAEALGVYQVAVAVLDADGNASEAREAAVELVESGGLAGPRVDGFEPGVAAAGETISVRGRGFDGAELAVLVGDSRVGVLTAARDRLTLLAPTLGQSAPVTVVTRDGRGTSQSELTPKIAVRVVPDRFELSEGDSIQLTAVITGTRNYGVGWQLADGAGGEVSPSGRYTAPLFSGPQTVRVTATSSADPQATATSTGSLAARRPVRGPARLGRLGGTVVSEGGGSMLTVPEDALGQPTEVEVGKAEAGLADAGVPAGMVVVAAARVLPGDLQLRRPGVLTIPLRTYLEPGTSVPLQAFSPRTDSWTNLDQSGLVVGGDRVRIEGATFYGGIIRAGFRPPRPVPDPFLPQISDVDPETIDEGATAAVLITGQYFVPGETTLTVLDASGQAETRVEVRTIYVTADGTQLGVTLKAGVMTDLGEGDTRPIVLQLSTPAGSAAGWLTIIGHDELNLPAGSMTLSSSTTFSRLTVGQEAQLTVVSQVPPIQITVTERAQINTQFDADGGVVQVASGAGQAGTPGRAGGAGGTGGVPSGGVFVPGGGGAGGAGGTDCNTPGAAGAAGAPSPGNGVGGPGGAGGAGDLAQGGDGMAGGSPPPSGLPLGYRPLLPGPGGGGGGGGGGEGWLITNTGGGGGGGGAGGGALRLSAGEQLLIDGDVFAVGGDGGGGAYPSGGLLFGAGRGAGGGGGGGGTLVLHGATWQSGYVLAVAGESFPVPPWSPGIDPRTPLQKLLDQPPTGYVQIDRRPRPGEQALPVAIGGPDLDYCFNLVSPNPQFEVSGPPAEWVGVHIQDRKGNEQYISATAVDPTTGFNMPVPLYEGFNDIQAEAFLDPLEVFAFSAPVRKRTVLYLPGTTSSFGFACTVSPAAVSVPTERSTNLTVAVTGTSLTAVTWSVDGGAANGTITQTGTYTAPCSPPSGTVTARASSALDPSRSCTAQITVLAGITVTATAAAGTPANPAVPSANVGQTVTIDIPAAVYQQTGTGLTPGQAVAFTTVQRSPGGACTTSVVTVQGNVAVGLTSLTVAVPACADAEQTIQVPGNGCAQLQIVPVISNLDTTSLPVLLINGTGFVCGATDVYIGTSKVPSTQVLAVYCTVIVVDTTNISVTGQAVTVQTKGGTSNAVTA